MAVSRVFSSNNLKPVVVSLKPGFFGGVGGLTPGWAGPEGRSGALKFLLEKTSETVIFGPSFTETVKKKKWAVSP